MHPSLGYSRPIDPDAIGLAVGIDDFGARARAVDLEPHLPFVKGLGTAFLFTLLEMRVTSLVERHRSYRVGALAGATPASASAFRGYGLFCHDPSDEADRVEA